LDIACEELFRDENGCCTIRELERLTAHESLSGRLDLNEPLLLKIEARAQMSALSARRDPSV